MRTKLLSGSIIRAAVAGFVGGLLISVAYIAFTGDPFPLFLPTWAAIIFYPGTVVGWCTGMFFERELHMSLSPYTYIVIGCIAQGVACAAISILAGCGIILFRRLASRVAVT